MSLTPHQAAGLVDELHTELLNRQPLIEKYDNYYAGQQKLKYASQEFAEAFGGLFTDFADNWCGVVVDAKAERLEVVGFRADGERENDRKTWDLWRSMELDAISNAAFLDTLIGARSFGLAWEGPDGLEMTFEHASQAIVGYYPGSRRRKAGLKCWSDDTHEYATLYTADELWKFQRARLSTSSGLQVVTTARFGQGQWVQREVAGETWPLTHTLGAVPLVELQNRLRLAREPHSELESVVPMQDGANLLWSHMFTTSDFAAFPQRVLLGIEPPLEAIRNEAGEIVGEREIPLDRFRVSRIARFTEAAPGAKIDQWAAADLSNYTQVIELVVQHIAAQTKTPPDYLLGKMANLSGEALTAAERGLVSAVIERQNAITGGIREFMRLGHLANGDPESAEKMRLGTVRWKDPQYRTEGEHVDALMKMKAIGVPEEALWERLADVDQTEIERWKNMQAEQTARSFVGDLAGALSGAKPVTDESVVNGD